MDTGEKIRYFRRKAGMGMEELGKRIGVSRQTVHRYETGVIENIPKDKLLRMAQLFGVSVAAFFGPEGEAFAYTNVMPVCRRSVPLLGEIACGAPLYAEGQVESYMAVGEDISADFCLRARGDSMIGARIHDGDLVFVRAQSAVENGEIGVVIIDDEATLKRVYYYPEKEKLVLLPENAAYEPLVYVGSELETIRVIGKAIAFQSSLA